MIKLWIISVAMFVAGDAVGQQGVRNEALDLIDSQAQAPAADKSLEDLAADYAFQYRQELQSRLSRLAQSSAGATRETDPFGAPLRTTLREQEQTKPEDVASPDEQAAQQARQNFGQAVRGLDIRAINAGRKEFLSGADNVFEGDIMDISSGSGIYRVWIVAVKDDGITFMDYRSRQTETVPLSLDAPAVPGRPWGATGGVQDAPPF
jgi:hypothetical protein